MRLRKRVERLEEKVDLAMPFDREAAQRKAIGPYAYNRLVSAGVKSKHLSGFWVESGVQKLPYSASDAQVQALYRHWKGEQ